MYSSRLHRIGPTLAAMSWMITGSYFGLMMGMVVAGVIMLLS
ncbi:hypothetical protein [uncultured Ruegeria sp.]|nr:hypothetical protein [uncultured Ruegeria sp.]